MLGWLRKNRDDDESKDQRTGTQDVERVVPRVSLARGDILRWRDDNLEYIELETRRALNDLMVIIDDRLKDAHQFHLKRFDAKQARPLIAEMAESLASHCRKRAIETLEEIPGAQPIASEEKKRVSVRHPSVENLDATTDSILATAGLIGGAAAVPVTASMATVSAGGLAGLLGATVISWPVVLVGGAISAVLFAGGAFKGKSVAEKKELYRNKLYESLKAQFLTENKSLAVLLREEIEQAAQLLEAQIPERGPSC